MIRRATPADAEVLSALSRTCFTQTFGHLYAPADLEVFLDEAYAPDILRGELEDPNRATWLLFEDATDEAPIGYVTACPAHLPHPNVAPSDGEIQRLYILQGHQGGGRGTLLLNTALDWLERDGPRTLWIGVWSENYGAQRFYARHGFEIVGDYSFMVGDHADHELITRRPARPTR
ncbi:MAG: GNAT family N-acetyltransferase [Actinomyces sp.]|nr:GNAT family N-acetyltransferase [Actinomyces sp.]